ncbi:uncharacterized protein IUM83_16349 [Phytophthora cinnamomi]|uniref:uncharacterized protein n=1 Tax=Phytophthora cinnamomi TaxID=4785 RepID=UPI00355A87D9|nr:hypothetical protein IUM83_16349 [Phytophthora cinnamomi]
MRVRISLVLGHQTRAWISRSQRGHHFKRLKRLQKRDYAVIQLQFAFLLWTTVDGLAAASAFRLRAIFSRYFCACVMVWRVVRVPMCAAIVFHGPDG